MAIPNPNPNIADGLKCDNKTYSSNKIESLIKVATELPIPEDGDTGKVLTVNDELGYDLETAPGDRLPETALTDAGKVVTVNDAGDSYELKTPVAPTSIIDDSTASDSTVYSSNKINNIVTGINNNITILAYRPGDTITASTYKHCAGRTNNAGDKVLCFYPTYKYISANVSAVSITFSADANVYTSTGAIAATPGTYQGTITDGGIYFLLDLSNQFSDGGRSATIEFQARTITFS